MSADAGAAREPALPTADAQRARRRLGRLLADRRRGVAGLLLLTAGATAATVAGPALIGVVIDAVTGSREPGVVDAAAVAYAVLAVVGAGLRYLAGVRAAVLGESALRELRTEAFDHALDLPVDVVERAGTGELVSRMTGDVGVLARAVRQTVPQVVFSCVEIALILVALVLLDWRLAGVALAAGTPVAAVGGRWYARHAPARYRDERQAHATLAAGLLQGYAGRATLSAYRASRRYRGVVVGLGRDVVDAELSSTSARNRLRPSVSVSLAFGLVAVVAVGWSLVEAGSATVGGVSAAALYVVRLFDPVSVLLEEVDEVQQASASVARLVGVGDAVARTGPTSVRVPVAPSPSKTGGVDVELRAVRFGYDPSAPVLDGVDLRIEAGERVTVVGASGAGKTTVAKLVAGLHHPWSGEVRLGGRPVGDLDPATRAATVALVTQDAHVFARSLADNLRLARPDLSDARLLEALEEVGARRWVERLPGGLDTVVGADHHRLTPPQAQQVGLARLLCADPAVVVLDEATADLDALAAARTERHLAAALAGRTVVTVAHRLDAAERADRVVVMEAGTIVATGTHAELLAAGGTYAELWAHWRRDRWAGDPEPGAAPPP